MLMLTDHLQKVKEDLKADISKAFRENLEAKKKELQNELDLRTAQIADIQQKCNDDLETSKAYYNI